MEQVINRIRCHVGRLQQMAEKHYKERKIIEHELGELLVNNAPINAFLNKPIFGQNYPVASSTPSKRKKPRRKKRKGKNATQKNKKSNKKRLQKPNLPKNSRPKSNESDTTNNTSDERMYSTPRISSPIDRSPKSTENLIKIEKFTPDNTHQAASNDMTITFASVNQRRKRTVKVKQGRSSDFHVQSQECRSFSDQPSEPQRYTLRQRKQRASEATDPPRNPRAARNKKQEIKQSQSFNDQRLDAQECDPPKFIIRRVKTEEVNESKK